MIKKCLLLLVAMSVIGKSRAQVQPCGTDEMHKQILLEYPELKEFEAQLEKQIQAKMRSMDLSKFAKKTTADETDNEDFWYDIPIVIHIIHDYNTYSTSGTFSGDFIPDDFIFNAVKRWNVVFAKQNSDTADVIPPFRKWIGNPHIRLHLATKDPLGNPTKGITRRRSYLTYAGGQQAKFDDWAPTSYINIWFINRMSAANGNAAAYAHYPSSVAYIPFYDGIISLAGYMNNGSKTINHEMGHVMNLSHVWGDTNDPNVECGDDNVDDTPPTKGHPPGSGCSFAALYDTTCSTNYFKIYTDASGNIELVNYPDTNNSQNIMDYTYCDKMFSKGQSRRMHITLNSDVGGRNNLWDPVNLAATGALGPVPDLKPIPDYTVTSAVGGSNYLTKNSYFTFPDKDVKFTNFTTNDTVTALSWVFTNGTATYTSASTTNFNQSFTEPGWVKLEMTATGNNTGDNKVTWEKALFIADKTGTNAATYLQEFDPSGDRDKWPTFNYYNNEFKWGLANTGVWDNNCMMYKGYDDRVTPTSQPYTGSPKGDFDDMFTVPMDLTPFTGGPCNLNYHYSGASRSSNSASISDTLLIDYTVNKGASWINIAKIGKGDLCNKGVISTSYVPSSPMDWAARTITVPAAGITNYTTFRFRYLPGVSTNGITSSGNNFYIDRIHVSQWIAETDNINNSKASVSIVPNPTHGDAWVVVNDAANSHVDITVSDITGKVVYTTSAPVSGTQARIVIPASAIAVSGMYLVQVLTGNQVSTQKLVVY